jgi:hypothetical protein
MIMVKLKKVGAFLAKKQVGIPLLVVATALITATTVFALVGNDQPASELKSKDAFKSASNTLGAQTNDTESNGESDQSSANTGSSAPSASPKVAGQTTQPSQASTPNGNGSTPAPTTPKPTTPSPTTPAYPSPSISFSSDGCFVTLTGTPGWVMTGEAETGFDEDGNPRRGAALSNSDYVMPSNGPVTILVGVPGYSQADWRLTARLSDQSGNVKATKQVLIGSSASPCQ